MPERIRIGLAELAAPLPNRLIRHDDAPGEEEFLHVAVAETEPELEPDAMADDLGREAVVLIAVGGWCIHATSMSHHASTGQVALSKLTMRVRCHRVAPGQN